MNESITQTEIDNTPENNDEKQTSFSNNIYNTSIKLAGTNLGQFIIKKIDKLLWITENTGKWSIPYRIESDENNSSEVKTKVPPPHLIRPLPWILFIPALIIMRIVRAGLAILFTMLGKDVLTPESIVISIQNNRRKLRTIKCQGIKIIRTKYLNNQTDNKSKGFISNFINLINYLFCFGKKNIETTKIIINSTNEKTSQATENGVSNDCKKQAEEEEVDDEESSSSEEEEDESNMNCNELLNKYGNKETDDENDLNYEPAEESSVSEDSSDEEESGNESEPESNKKNNEEHNVNNTEETSNDKPNENNISNTNNSNEVQSEENKISNSPPKKTEQSENNENQNDNVHSQNVINKKNYNNKKSSKNHLNNHRYNFNYKNDQQKNYIPKPTSFQSQTQNEYQTIIDGSESTTTIPSGLPKPVTNNYNNNSRNNQRRNRYKKTYRKNY